MGDDVDDIAVLISEEEPWHSPVLVREWMNDLQRGSNNAFMDGIDLGRSRHANADGRVAEDVPSSVELWWRSGEHQAALTS